MKVHQAGLNGEYGDIFWTLDPSLMYVAGSEIFVRIYVANTTAISREYMLMAKMASRDTVLGEFTVTVDGESWFEVEAETIISLPSTLVVDHTDIVLTLQLYEKSTNEVTDTVSTALYSEGTQVLPALPGIPTVGFNLSDLISMMMLMMMIVMMSKAMKEKEEEEK